MNVQQEHRITYRWGAGGDVCSCDPNHVFTSSTRHADAAKDPRSAKYHLVNDILPDYNPITPVLVGKVHKPRVVHEYWVYDLYDNELPEMVSWYWNSDRLHILRESVWQYTSRFFVLRKNSVGWRLQNTAQSTEQAIGKAHAKLMAFRGRGENVELMNDIVLPPEPQPFVESVAELVNRANRASSGWQQVQVLQDIEDLLEKVDYVQEAKERLLQRMTL